MIKCITISIKSDILNTKFKRVDKSIKKVWKIELIWKIMNAMFIKYMFFMNTYAFFNYILNYCAAKLSY